MSSRIGAMLLALYICAGGAASAQETINTGSISGRVTDPQGAVVPGAAVVARQVDTNVANETVTDAQGRFRFAYLKVGSYDNWFDFPIGQYLYQSLGGYEPAER